MQNTTGYPADIHGFNPDADSPIVPQNFIGTDGIDAADDDSQANSIYTPLYFATLDNFADNTENQPISDLNDHPIHTIHDHPDENQSSLANSSNSNVHVTDKLDDGTSRGNRDSVISERAKHGNDDDNSLSGAVMLQPNDSLVNRIKDSNVDVDDTGLSRRLLDKENRDGNSHCKRKGFYISQSTRTHNINTSLQRDENDQVSLDTGNAEWNSEQCVTEHGQCSPALYNNTLQNTSFGILRYHNQTEDSNFTNKEITIDLEFGTDAVDIFEQELSEDQLKIDFKESNYILFPEKHEFHVSEDDKENNLSWEGPMEPHRDESDEGGNSIRVGEDERASDYWDVEKVDESLLAQSRGIRENLLCSSQGSMVPNQPKISVQSLQNSLYAKSGNGEKQDTQHERTSNQDNVSAAHDVDSVIDSASLAMHEDDGIIRMEELDTQNDIQQPSQRRQSYANPQDGVQQYMPQGAQKTHGTSGNSAGLIGNALFCLPNKANDKVEVGTVDEKAANELQGEPQLLKVPNEDSIDIIEANESLPTTEENPWGKECVQSDKDDIYAPRDERPLNDAETSAPITCKDTLRSNQLSGPVLDENLNSKHISKRDTFGLTQCAKPIAVQQDQFLQPPQKIALNHVGKTRDLTMMEIQHAIPSTITNQNASLREAAKMVEHCTGNGSLNVVQSSVGAKHPLHGTTADKRREHVPFVSHRSQNNNLRHIFIRTETPLPPHANCSIKHQREFAAKRQIRRAVRQAMRSGNRERTSIGKGKREPGAQIQPERVENLQASNETPLLADNTDTTPPTATAAAGNTLANKAPNHPTSTTTPPIAQAQGSHLKLSAARGRVEKSGGSKRGGNRNPATAHLTAEQRRQIRAQRNRESAEKSRVRRKQQTFELEQSVWSLRKENKKCKKRFGELEKIVREVEKETQVHAKGRAGEKATKISEAVNESLVTIQTCKEICFRTFHDPRSPEIELKMINP